MRRLWSVPILIWVILLAIVLLAGALGYLYWQSEERYQALTSTIGELQEQLTTATATLAENIEQKTSSISETLSKEQERVSSISSQVGGLTQTTGQIASTVGALEKLSKTDPELLQKYSKVFFLNEHYVPERVSEIPAEYLYFERNPEVIHAGVYGRLKALLDASKAAGETLYIFSAYRSFDEQSKLKGAYTVTYGAGTANQFSADQGYSEHQLGTTVDFITTGLGGQLTGFDGTSAYRWLLANAHRYGFTLSYPQGNSYYIFEPWHWRYVGVELATYLFTNGKHFYDLDQRFIDQYLVKIFD